VAALSFPAAWGIETQSIRPADDDSSQGR
jgi:hypothetical protein